MRLEEFKAALESDASKRCEEQELTIKALHARINDLNQSIHRLTKDKRQLMNRCKVSSRGLLCLFCGFKNECDKEDSHG